MSGSVASVWPPTTDKVATVSLPTAAQRLWKRVSGREGTETSTPCLPKHYWPCISSTTRESSRKRTVIGFLVSQRYHKVNPSLDLVNFLVPSRGTTRPTLSVLVENQNSWQSRARHFYLNCLGRADSKHVTATQQTCAHVPCGHYLSTPDTTQQTRVRMCTDCIWESTTREKNSAFRWDIWESTTREKNSALVGSTCSPRVQKCHWKTAIVCTVLLRLETVG